MIGPRKADFSFQNPSRSLDTHSPLPPLKIVIVHPLTMQRRITINTKRHATPTRADEEREGGPLMQATS